MIAKLCCVQIFSGRSRSPKLVFAASGDSINPPAIVRLAAPPRGSRSSGTKRGTHRMWRRVDAARHLRRPTARRVDANNALTWAFAWCPHQSSNLGPRDYHRRVPGRL